MGVPWWHDGRRAFLTHPGEGSRDRTSVVHRYASPSVRSGAVIMVASIVATSRSGLPCSGSATASPAHTVIVRPGFVTRPRAMTRRPRAGATKFTLYSIVSTSTPAGSRLRAA